MSSLGLLAFRAAERLRGSRSLPLLRQMQPNLRLTPDERLEEAAEAVRSRQQPDGSWEII